MSSELLGAGKVLKKLTRGGERPKKLKIKEEKEVFREPYFTCFYPVLVNKIEKSCFWCLISFPHT
jgi:hypothetical protein